MKISNKYQFQISNFKFFSLFRNSSRREGYIALYTVLIILAVAIVVGATTAALSISEGQAGFSVFKGEDRLDLVEGCAEDALMNSRNSINYTSETITRPEGSCTVTVSKVGTTWTILIVPITTSDYRRRVQITATRTTTATTVTRWEEL